MWSFEISGDRVPVHLIRVELTLECVVAAANSSSAGGKELLWPKLGSQASDSKFPSFD